MITLHFDYHYPDFPQTNYLPTLTTLRPPNCIKTAKSASELYHVKSHVSWHDLQLQRMMKVPFSEGHRAASLPVEASCGCPKYANDVYMNIHNPNPNPNPNPMGGRKRLPKFKFSAKFPIGLHVILQIQIKEFENDCYLMWKIILTENPSRCNLAPLLK